MSSCYKTFRQIAVALAEAVDTTDLGNKSLVRFFTRRLAKKEQTVRDTYQACLGRLPEADFATGGYLNAKAAATHIVDSLNCIEFLRNVPLIVANAFPEAPRMFFVHIPKTGGTAIKAQLRNAGCFVWDPAYADPAWLSEDGGVAMLIRMIADQARRPDRPIVVAGHQTVDWFKATKLIRASDRVFTVIRHPDEIALSWINYTMMVLLDGAERPDGILFHGWLSDMGVAPPRHPDEITPAMIGALLQHPEVVAERTDILTRYLSSDGTAASVIDNIRYFNIDVIDIGALDGYMFDDLALSPVAERINASRSFIAGFRDLPWQQRVGARMSIGSRDALIYAMLQDLMGDDRVLRPMRDLR